MFSLLSFNSPLEFILRYTVIFGIILAIAGVALCLMAKAITLSVRKKSEMDKNDKLFATLMFVGIALILVGMIVMVLPIEATFYKG